MTNAHPQQINRRKRFFIDKRIQSRMIGLVVFFLVLFALIAALLVMSSNRSQAPIIIGIIVVAFLLTVFVIYYGLRFTHRLVGPIYAFNRHIALVRDGHYKNDLRLRKDDEFQNLAISFNTMLGRIRERTKRSVELCDDLLAELDKNAGGADLEPLKQRVQSFKAEQEKLLNI